jgi:hypothetical protein
MDRASVDAEVAADEAQAAERAAKKKERDKAAKEERDLLAQKHSAGLNAQALLVTALEAIKEHSKFADRSEDAYLRTLEKQPLITPGRGPRRYAEAVRAAAVTVGVDDLFEWPLGVEPQPLAESEV